jgi:hypothetical protein
MVAEMDAVSFMAVIVRTNGWEWTESEWFV